MIGRLRSFIRKQANFIIFFFISFRRRKLKQYSEKDVDSSENCDGIEEIDININGGENFPNKEPAYSNEIGTPFKDIRLGIEKYSACIDHDKMPNKYREC